MTKKPIGREYDPNDGPIERLWKGRNNITGSHGLVNFRDVHSVLKQLEEKDAWIQKAKALFFDLLHCGPEELEKDIQDFIEEAGGYDPYVESSETELRWKK